ncbi:hypothetical protein K491DRAFT_586320 [Lophiostoma macrostomum CBS 122681]|uniref:Uncharacterized protein n=1 Tax=Lophiostoma macrostomum CBS 122681 TaxID=1314788 RepID=A0A6A6TPZ2_9PLEO|nr:hypothetical protein K491DRAFT_586320 [Lophiostoma macrostomum CBS 122681]
MHLFGQIAGAGQRSRLRFSKYKGTQLNKRLTLAIDHGQIVSDWYSVFSLDKNAVGIAAWLD